MIVYKCDFCDQIRECAQQNIEGKEYDICLECVEAKLKARGRTKDMKPIRKLQSVKGRDRYEKRDPFPAEVPTIIWRGRELN